MFEVMETATVKHPPTLAQCQHNKVQYVLSTSLTF